MTCWWCLRDVSDGCYVRVSMPDGSVAECCDTCYSRADEDWRIDLDWRGEL